jgi:transposase
MHLRGRENILKRLVVHSGAANLALLMRKLFGKGTPRGPRGRHHRLFSVAERFISVLTATASIVPAFLVIEWPQPSVVSGLVAA